MKQETLVVFIQAAKPESPIGVLLDVANQPLQYIPEASASTLPALAVDRSVIMVVAAEDVLLATVKLPVMNKSRLMKALPFALEDQVIDDIENMHVVALDVQSDGTVTAAVATHAKMQAWQALAQSLGVKPNVILPLTLCVPYQENNWCVLLLEKLAIIRTGKMLGVTMDEENLNAYAASHPIQVLTGSQEEQWKLAAKEAAMASSNLLQGKYAVKKSRMPQMNKVWRMVNYAALTAVIALFLYPTISYFILQTKLSFINDDIYKIYKHQFPEATSMVAPKIRFQEKLQKISGQMGENHPLVWLGEVGRALKSIPGIKLKRVDFQHNQLTLELTAQSSEEISSLTESLTQQGLTVKQQNANMAGARVSALLIITSS